MKNKFIKKYKHVLITNSTQGMAKLSLAVVSGLSTQVGRPINFVKNRLNSSAPCARSLSYSDGFSVYQHCAGSTTCARALSLLGIFIVVFGLIVGMSAIKTDTAHAATSNTLNFQGRLLTATGGLVPDGTYNVEFNLYYVASAGSSLWTETHTNQGGNPITIQNGYYSVYLGDTTTGTAFPGTIDWSEDLYLGMTVRGTGTCAFGACTPTDSEMTPRFKLTSVPYAFRAANVASSSTNAASTDSDDVTITTGNALGATSNSGDISIDVGTATGTAGTLLFGTSSASALTIGRSGVTTTIQGSLALTGASTALTVTNDVVVNGNTTLGDSTADTLTVEANATFNGSLTVSAGDQFTNAGSSLFTAMNISDVAGGGDIGTAVVTVDIATTFNINQTTASQTLTLPTPTSTTAGRIVYVNNVGSASFTMYGSVIATNKSNAFIWNGSTWVTTVSLSGSVVNTIGTIDSQTKSADGAVIAANAVYLQTADLSFPGLVSTAAQSFNGVKTFDDGLVVTTGGATISAGALAVNSDSITSDSNLTIDATGYVRIGDSGTPNVANGDDDLYVEGDLEADGLLNVQGTAVNGALNSVATIGGTVASTGAGNMAGLLVNPTLTLSTSSDIDLYGAVISPSTSTNNLDTGTAGLIAVGSGAAYTGTGTIINLTGLATANINASSGTVSNSFGLSIGQPTNAGTITRNNGAFIAQQTVGTNNTNLLIATSPTAVAGNWNIYSDSTYDNVFAGNFRVGGTTAPTVALDVTGSGAFSGDLAVNGGDITTASGNLTIAPNGGATTVTGTLAVTTLGSADTNTYLCRNTSNQLATCSSTPLSSSLTDNIADAFDLQEGTNNYININTTNSSENISFGNATTNPSYSFLGSGTLTVSGATTSTGLITGNAGLTVTGGTVSVNASSNNNTNINTGTSTGTVAIGNSASTTTVLGTTTINTTGTATTGIGNSGAAVTLTGSSILLNSATLQRTAAGTTSLDLVDGSDTTLALINSGAGVANLTVDGSITVANLGSTDNASFVCRNSSNILAGCNFTPLSNSLTDNVTDALDIQEGTNNYININTTNSSENISFGNTTTNPSYNFLGSGALSVAGNLAVDTNTLFVDATSNSVGIGTTTTTSGQLVVSGSYIDPIDNFSGVVSTQSFNYSAASSNSNYSAYFTAVDTSDTDTSGSTGAIFAQSIASGTFGATNLYGINAGIKTQGTSPYVTNATGLNIFSALNVGTGSLTTLKGINIESPTTTLSGSAGSVYGIDIANLDGAIVTTNTYGLRIAAQSGASTNNVGLIIGEAAGGANGNSNLILGTTTVPAGSFSIYNSSNDDNVFAGNFRVGGTTAPTVALDVTGSGAFSGDLAVNGGDITTASGNLTIAPNGGATTVTGTLAVTTLGSADTNTYLCRNTSNQLATCSSTPLSSSLTDNIADAFDLQEGTNNYININTTNSLEEIQFGNTTTNPYYSFLGSGVSTFGGTLNVTDGTDVVSISPTAGSVTIDSTNDYALLVQETGTSSDIFWVDANSTGGFGVNVGGYLDVSGLVWGDWVGADSGFSLWDGGSHYTSIISATQSGDYSITIPALSGNTTFCLQSNNCSYISASLTDNITDALDIQEGTNNYINITTTNSSENISFGNTTTNPSFSFLGSGSTSIAGQLTLNGTAADQIQLVVKANSSQTATTPLVQAQDSAGNELYSIRAPDEYSIYLGYRAGYIDDGSGGQNTGVGSSALLNNVGGYYNVAIGSLALSTNDDGASNVAIGQQAITSNVSGTQNTAVGGSALFSSTGNYNTALGFESGYNTTGAENIFLGYKAGRNLTTGSYNILIGNELDAVSTTANYQLNIGNILFGTNVDGFNSTLSTGNLGVGTSSPGARLEVKAQAGGSQVGFIVDNNTSTGNIFEARDGGSPVFTVANGGAATFQNAANTTTAFQILEASGSGGSALLTADTTNYLLKVAPTQFVSSGSTQSFATSGSITGVDDYSTVAVNATVAGVTVTVPAPAAGGQVVGRVLYVAAVNGSQDFILSLSGTSVDINMKANSTATLIWNGTGWTAAGASSSTDLQAAYDNTAATAGGAEIVLSNSGTKGLTIRNDSTSAITGGLLEIQNSIGSNLFSVNNNATEFANNGGAESSTFTMWTAAPTAGGTISQYTTVDDNIATGAASVFVNGSATAGSGVRNTLTTTLTRNLRYRVSFAVRHTSSTTIFSTLDVRYSPSGTNTDVEDCSTGNTVNYGQWTRITCTFVYDNVTAPNSSNAILFTHSDAVDHDIYIDNLSVTVSADVNHAADGSVEDAGTFATNWVDYDAGTGSTTEAQDGSIIYDGTYSASATTTADAGQGLRNNMAITPTVNTQYLVTFYARSSNTFNDIRVRYSRDGGTNFVSCTDFNTQSVSTSSFTEITCLFTTDGTTATNADLIIDQPTGTARTFYIDALSITLNTNNSNNVQIGGGNKGGPVTLFTLDRSAGAPIAANNDAYLGSMYYDTTTGRIQCYEADGWGACGAAPDNVVNLNPEYAGAVLNGSGVGTMTADFCSNDAQLSVNSTLCGSGEAKNYYRWTSPQATQQTYSIYVTYQLPETFNGFANDDTVQLYARTDSTTNAAVTYEMYKSTGSDVSQCGTGETTVVTSANTWQSVGINGNESTGCSLNSSSAGNFVIFKINLKANSNANAYVSTLSFTTTGR